MISDRYETGVDDDTDVDDRLEEFVAALRTPQWMRQAACKGTDPDLWFPERGELTSEARAICQTCPVRQNCLEYGLRERFGIWGGMSERARRQLRHQRTVVISGDRPCRVVGCDQRAIVHGLCRMHSRRLERTGSVLRDWDPR